MVIFSKCSFLLTFFLIGKCFSANIKHNAYLDYLIPYNKLTLNDSISKKTSKIKFNTEFYFLSFIPKNNTAIFQAEIPTFTGLEKANFNITNKTTFNVGVSAGMEFQMQKRLQYSLSLDYFYFSRNSDVIGTENFYSIVPTQSIDFNGKFSVHQTYNFFSLGSGVIFNYKNFLFYQGVKGAYIKTVTKVDLVYNNGTTSDTPWLLDKNNFYFTETNVNIPKIPVVLFSETKIGISLFHSRINLFTGIYYAVYEKILPISEILKAGNNSLTSNYIKPFISIKYFL